MGVGRLREVVAHDGSATQASRQNLPSEVQLTYLGCQGPSMRLFGLHRSIPQARKKPSGPSIQLIANDYVKASEEK